MRQALLERSYPDWLGGIQRLYRFDNGYGASVVRFPYSCGWRCGLWELAVLRYEGESITDYRLDFNTEITFHVLGNLDDDEVDEVLARIEALPTPIGD